MHNRVHFGLENNETVLAGRLGLIEGDVGVAQQLGGRGSNTRCDPDTGRERERTIGQTLQVERRTEHRKQPFCHELGTGVHSGAVDEHDELVAAQAADAVALTHGRRPIGPSRPQKLVARSVTERVVDALEAVEVDEEGGRRHIGAAGPGQHLLGAVEDQAPVGQAGKGIVQGLEADLIDQTGHC